VGGGEVCPLFFCSEDIEVEWEFGERVWRAAGSGVSELWGEAKETEGCGSAAHPSRFRDWSACIGEWVQVTDPGRGRIYGLISAIGSRDAVNSQAGWHCYDVEIVAYH
jgi:hypothetical protein